MRLNLRHIDRRFDFHDANRAERPHVSDGRQRAAWRKFGFQLRLDVLDAFLPGRREQQFNTGRRDRAGKRIRHERRAVHEHARLAVRNRLRDAVSRQRRRKRHVAAGQRFAEAENIWLDSGMFAGKQLAGTPEAGRDFIENQQHAAFIARLPHAAQIVRRIKAHSARALHNRLKNHGGNLLSMRR